MSQPDSVAAVTRQPTGDDAPGDTAPVAFELAARATVPAFVFTWLCAAVASSVPLVVFADPDEPTSIPVLGVSLLAGWVAFLVGTTLTSRAYGSGNALEDFGISLRPIDALGVPLGVAAQLGLVPLVYVPLRAIWPATFDDDALSETARDLIDRANGAQLGLLVVLVVIGAPIVEEVVYRGLLQRPLLQHAAARRFAAPAVVVGVAAVFALIHFRPIEYPGLFAAGLVFGVCAWRSGRVGMAIAAHVAFNATGLGLAL